MTARNFSRYLELAWSILLLIVDVVSLAFSKLIPAGLKRRKDIRNEIVLITGGGSGLGQLMAVRFAQLGCRVVIWDVDENGCKETARKVKHEVNGAQEVYYYILDVSNRDKVYETAKKVRMDVGDVTILVNNAGVGHASYFLDTPDSLLEKVFDINAMAHFWTMKAFLPHMMKNNHGHLVTIASASGVMALQRATAYVTSKHSSIGFLDSITMELIECGKTNVKTTVVCPYFTKTPLFQCDYDGFLRYLDPEIVVNEIMEGILTDKQMIYVPSSVILITFINRFVKKNSTFRFVNVLMGKALLNTIKVRNVYDEHKEEIS